MHLEDFDHEEILQSRAPAVKAAAPCPQIPIGPAPNSLRPSAISIAIAHLLPCSPLPHDQTQETPTEIVERPGTVWQSVTPNMHPRHAKKNFGIERQIERECRERGLPEPVGFEQLSTIEVGNQTRNAIRFHRFRGKRGLNQPDRHGSFWRMTFAEPVSGPIALGFACHFGLGLFKPVI
jgi:CRISPR-associated protein Csb2